MEFFIELLLDLILEGSMELSNNKKVPKWIRYIMIVFILLFFIVVSLLLLFIGLIIIKENLMLGIVVLILIIIFIFCGVKKFKKMYFEKKKIE